MIQIESLRVDYEDVTAVSDLNLTIQPGQIFGLVGPNGAGKTSTIKAIAGIIEPTYGEIKIDGIDLELKPEEALRKIGYMPDFPPVYELLKVWEYLDVFAAAYHIPRSHRIERIKFWVDQVKLTEKWNTLVHDLSRGMRQRLVLAKTLFHDPKVLLLDEPASGLDPIARKDMRDILKNVVLTDKTILISSHILTELSEFCNAIGIMEKGRMVISGSLQEIRNHIGTKKHIHIRLAQNNPNQAEQLKNQLNASQDILNVQQLNSAEFKINFKGTDQDASALLSILVNQKIQIANFHLEEASVEDIFFEIGAKEVS